MEDINSPVFAQAKIEYTKQLIDVLKLPLYEGLQKIYNDSKRIFADGYEDELPNIFRKSIENVPKWNSDIIDNIRFQSKLNIKLTYHIGGIEYTPEEINKFVLVSAPYQDFKIKITFLEKPNLGDEFKILSRHYIINKQDRKLLQTSNVISQNNVYTNGMCVKKNNI